MSNKLIIVLLATVSLLIYVKTLTFGFIDISDDLVNVVKFNKSFFEIFSESYMSMYIPLTYSTWKILSIFDSPFIYHLLNVLTHTANAYLVYLIALKFKFEFKYAMIISLIFLVHPFQVEPVSWVTGFKDLSSNFFGFLGLLCLLNKRFVLAAILPIVAVLFKPSAICFLFIYAFLSIPFRNKRFGLCAFFSSLIVFPIVFFVSKLQGSRVEYIYDFNEKIYIALDSIGWYFSRFIVPIGLNADEARLLPEILMIAIGVIVILLAVIKKNIGLSIFIISLAPVLGFIPFNYQNWSNVADRYMYLPMFGLALMVGSLIKKDKVETILTTILIPTFALSSHMYTYNWKDVETLHKHAISTPRSLKPNSLRILSIYYENERLYNYSRHYEEMANRVKNKINLNMITIHNPIDRIKLQHKLKKP